MNACKKAGVCPYYYSRWAVEHSQLVLAPYNYITSVSIRHSAQLLSNSDERESVLVVDEAHNIEDSLMESFSFTFSENFLENTVIPPFFYHSLRMDSIPEMAHQRAEMESLIEATNGLCELIGSVTLNKVFMSKERHCTITTEAMEMFANRLPPLVKLIKALVRYKILVDEVDEKTITDSEFVKTLNPLIPTYLEMFFFYIQVFKDYQLSRYFKIIVKENTELSDREMHVFCLSPSLPMSFIQQSVRSIIFASGTLSPLRAMAQELDIIKHPYRSNIISPG